MKDELDVRGKPCPQPVLETRARIEESWPARLEVRVDEGAPQENVRALARSLGYQVEVIKGSCGAERLSLARTDDAGPGAGACQDEATVPGIASSCSAHGAALVLLTDTLGHGDAELGHKLMHGFLRTTLDSDPKPWRIVMLNHGVRLSTVDDIAVDALNLLAESGTEDLSCGTCLEHLDLGDRPAVDRDEGPFAP